MFLDPILGGGAFLCGIEGSAEKEKYNYWVWAIRICFYVEL